MRLSTSVFVSISSVGAVAAAAGNGPVVVGSVADSASAVSSDECRAAWAMSARMRMSEAMTMTRTTMGRGICA